MKLRALTVFIVASSALRLGVASMLVAAGSSATAQTTVADDGVISFRVRFGMTDKQARSWNGELSVSNGEVLELRNWAPHPSEEILGNSGWSLATRQNKARTRRAFQKEYHRGTLPYMDYPGIVVDARVVRGGSVRFKTEQGDFAINPRELRAGRALTYLDGAVVVDRVPTADVISTSDYDNDFATMLDGDNGLDGDEGQPWVAWVAYRDRGNYILTRRFDGGGWGSAVSVADQPADIYLAQMGRDPKGRPWVVWSQQDDGNFDLYGSYWDGEQWSRADRLTTNPQPDIEHALTTDAEGNLWLVWQGFRNGKSDIFARRYVASEASEASEDGSSWSPEEKVSTSPANDWQPAVAADGRGSVYVAWDTYDQGNYDVVMRRFDQGKWDDVTPIADTPLFEAHVSLACDNEDRLWAAWNESGFQWGKDTGFGIGKEATRLYDSRSIAVSVFESGHRRVPAADINSSLPSDLQSFNDFPLLKKDAAGRMWVFFRHRHVANPDILEPSPLRAAAWQIHGTAYDGSRWTEPQHLPFSRNRQDVRWGLASNKRGNLLAAWPTDDRDAAEFGFRSADVYSAKLPALLGEPTELQLRDPVAKTYSTHPVHPNEAEDVARIRNYKIESEGKTYRIYRGDTHRHTEFSIDGRADGSLLQAYRYALDAADLDFLGVSEHNVFAQDIEYINWLVPQFSDLFHLPRSFVPIYTYERSLSYPNGHRNILVAKRGMPTLVRSETEIRGDEGAAKLFAYLKRYNAIAISHTSATDMGTDWRDNDPEVEPLVEIYQGDRYSSEYEGAPRAATRERPMTMGPRVRPAGFVWKAWAKGYKLGVQASSDHISTHISYAATIATEFTREGLLSAMRKRHSYGATDNIILDYRLQAGGKEYLQGDLAAVSEPFQLWIKVLGTSAIRQVDIIKNHTFVHNRQNLGRDVSFTFVDNDVGPGENYYYVRVIQNDGEMAWSSPIWVTAR